MARQSGKHATVTIGSYTGADLYNVEVRMSADLIDVTAVGDDWVVQVPGVGHWEVRAEKYYASEEFLSLVAATPTALTTVNVSVKDGANNTVFSGTGYVTEGVFSVPNEAVTESVVIQGVGAPSAPT